MGVRFAFRRELTRRLPQQKLRRSSFIAGGKKTVDLVVAELEVVRPPLLDQDGAVRDRHVLDGLLEGGSGRGADEVGDKASQPAGRFVDRGVGASVTQV